MAHTVYAVASGKGGVGKTATTVNLGAALAERGHTVAIVDADLGMANLGGFLGLDPDGPTLHEVLAGKAPLQEAVYEIDAGLAAVPSGISLEGFANIETEALSDAIDGLRESFDYVLLDLGAGLSHDTVLPLALADAVVLVSTPKPVALQDTAKTHQVTKRLGGAVAGVVLTRAVDPQGLDVEAVADRLGLPVLAVIPEDDAVDRSALAGVPVVVTDPETPATAGFRGLADIVIAESLANAPVVPEVPPADGPSPDEPADEQSPAEPTVTESSAGDPSAGESSAGDPSAGESSASDPSAGEPSAGGETATDDSTAEPTHGDAGVEAASPSQQDASETGERSGDSPAPGEESVATPGEDPLAPQEGAGPAPAADATPTGDGGADRDDELAGMDVEVDAAAEEIAAAIEQDAEASVEAPEGTDVQFESDPADEPADPGTGDGGSPRIDDGANPELGGEANPELGGGARSEVGDADESVDEGTAVDEGTDDWFGPANRPAPEPASFEEDEDAPFVVEENDDEDDDDSSGGLLSRLFG